MKATLMANSIRAISIVCIFLIITIVYSCKVDTQTPKSFPSDYLFNQRAYPHGKIDLAAHKKAVQQLSRPSFKGADGYNESWSAVGPLNISGRVTDIEVVPGDSTRFYVGTASGGILKTDDGGITWQDIFDEANSLSIGDLAIAPSNSDIIYAGTGESNAGGGSIAYDGDGIYRSDDAGLTWENKGPDSIGSIGKILVHPSNPQTVYIAAMGLLFENNKQRGIYKTTNGGDSWTQILFVSDSTGGIDLAIHPNNPDTIFAALWQRTRKIYNRQYGGETSDIYRSYDGGQNWTRLSSGLPSTASAKGRIGLAISPSSPNIVYAYYADAAGRLEGLYKTEDMGDNWTAKSTNGIVDAGFMWWFGKIFVHPEDENKLYATSIKMYASDDGGDSWYEIFEDAHVDHHAIGFLNNSGRDIINGNDGGIQVGIENGLVSEERQGLNNIQFYTCKIDPNNPSVIYGGAQDNGTLKTVGPEDEWRQIFGGDGFRIQIEPQNSNQIYFESQYGNIFASTNGGQTFYYGQDGLTGSFNWNTPIALDPENPGRLYTGAQKLFRSDSSAYVWYPISEELVSADNPIGNIAFGTITAIDVSTHGDKDILVGTDDGNLWLVDGNDHGIEDISIGIPKRWITSVAHDPHNEGHMYVTVSGFRFGESVAQVFRSIDNGSTWLSIGSNLPDIPVNDIIVDPESPGQLYLATDISVFYSTNYGDTWQILGSNLPNVPYLDLDIHPQSRTLVVASYGIGMLRYQLPLASAVEQTSNSNSWTVYPNPVHDYLFIKSGINFSSLKVFNLKGELVLSSGNQKTIPVAHLNPGIYFCQTQIQGKIIQQKFVKI